MEYRENPMFGRQVFFLNPPLSVENSIIPVLKNNDYEVYVIRECNCAKPILRAHENAICFIFIDDELSLDAWYNFIKSFEYDPALKSIFLGVISIKAKPKDQERFLLNLKLPGGFVMLEKNMEAVVENIQGILELNGAKGVRKCIRLELLDNKDVNGYFTNGTTLYSFRLVNISELGFAAQVPIKMAPIFAKGRVISNVSITMKRFSFVCTIVVFKTSIVNDSCLVVAMLHPETSSAVKKKIHDFIYDTLEIRHRIVLENIARDMTDYNIRQRVDGEEEVEDAEEVEEKGEAAEEVKEESAETAENVESSDAPDTPDSADNSESSEAEKAPENPS